MVEEPFLFYPRQTPTGKDFELIFSSGGFFPFSFLFNFSFLISIFRKVFMKEITLTKNKIIATVDDENYEDLLKYSWLIKSSNSKKYIIRRIKKDLKLKTIYMQKHILNTERTVDHIDGNPFNNCKNNLRICTLLENNWNRKIRKDSTNKYKGIEKKENSYRAVIVKMYKKYRSKHFKCSFCAALEYDKMALYHFGEFARTNF